MDLFITFDCIPDDLFISKLGAYDLTAYGSNFICSYLNGQKQCEKINSMKSDFTYIVSCVQHGSIVGPILV